MPSKINSQSFDDVQKLKDVLYGTLSELCGRDNLKSVAPNFVRG